MMLPGKNLTALVRIVFLIKLQALAVFSPHAHAVSISAIIITLALTATAINSSRNLTIGAEITVFTPLTASGGTLPYTYSVKTGTLPAGLALNGSTGDVTGTPTSAQAPADVVFEVKDANNVIAATTSTVTFRVNSEITATANTASRNLTVGAAITGFNPLTASGGPMPYTYRVKTGELPPGLTLKASTGEVTGIPTIAHSAVDVVFEVKDANNVIDATTSTVSFTVNSAITATASTLSRSLTVGVVMPGFTPLTASGGPIPYTYSIKTGALPAGLTLNASTGEVSGTPTTAQAVVDVVFEVKDVNSAVAAAKSTVSFMVKSVITATANTASQNLTIGAAMSGFTPLTASGGTLPYTYSIKIGTLPAGLTLNGSTGEVTGTPTTAQAAANVIFEVKGADEVIAATTSTVSFMVIPAIAIGDSYQGGIVFYINETGNPQGNIPASTPATKHGLIAAPADINLSYTDAWAYSSSTLYRWSTGLLATAYQSVDTGTAIGSGQGNTDAILAKWSLSTYPYTSAAMCDNYSNGGYTDWYLPSKDELYQLFIQKSTVGGFSSDGYWSSSNTSSITAWYLFFPTSTQGGFSKNQTKRVRPVRTF